jgi:hypothetical protein
MILLLVLLLILFYGTGNALRIGGDLLYILLILAIAGLVYQIWTGRNPS